MTRAGLAGMLRVNVRKLSRALDWSEYMAIERLGRICAALEIKIKYGEKHKASRGTGCAVNGSGVAIGSV